MCLKYNNINNLLNALTTPNFLPKTTLSFKDLYKLSTENTEHTHYDTKNT